MPRHVKGMTDKRKRNVLPLTKKIELVQRLEKGEGRTKLMVEFGVSSSTLYDLKKQKDKLLAFISSAEALTKKTENRKTLKGAKFGELDKALYVWFTAKRSEGKPITGLMITEKAKKIQNDLGITTEVCSFSDGWLRNFKERHGIRRLGVSGERRSADYVEGEKYEDEFTGLVEENDLPPSQIYDADETLVGLSEKPDADEIEDQEEKAEEIEYQEEKAEEINEAQEDQELKEAETNELEEEESSIMKEEIEDEEENIDIVKEEIEDEEENIDIINEELDEEKEMQYNWEDYFSNLHRSINYCRIREKFTDVTIVCGDGTYRAHRVILASCSEYFEKILSNAPGEHPVLVLINVKEHVVQQILDYIYSGELSLPQKDLQEFLTVAQQLGIRGLCSFGDSIPGVCDEGGIMESFNEARSMGFSHEGRSQAFSNEVKNQSVSNKEVCMAVSKGGRILESFNECTVSNKEVCMPVSKGDKILESFSECTSPYNPREGQSQANTSKEQCQGDGGQSQNGSNEGRIPAASSEGRRCIGTIGDKAGGSKIESRLKRRRKEAEHEYGSDEQTIRQKRICPTSTMPPALQEKCLSKGTQLSWLSTSKRKSSCTTTDAESNRGKLGNRSGTITIPEAESMQDRLIPQELGELIDCSSSDQENGALLPQVYGETEVKDDEIETFVIKHEILN